jgi:CBS domain containing-hemolysin-like protein
MTLTVLVLALVVMVALLASGFYSGAETAVISSDKARLRSEAERGNRQAQFAQGLLERSEDLMSATLVGNNIANIAATSFATLLVSRFVSPNWESAVTTLIMTPLVLIVGEIIPKSLGRAQATAMTLRVAGLLRTSQWLFRPVILLVGRIADATLTLVGIAPSPQSPYVSREELMAMAQLGEEHGILVSDERRMIHSILELRDRPVYTVMVPLVDMASLPIGATAADLAALAARRGFSRFPVYQGRVDNIVGVVRTLDVLNAVPPGDRAERPIEPFVRREVSYVPETKAVGELLHQLRYSEVPMAIVVDEHGGVVGLATTEDLVEEIVGRIRDPRHDQPRVVARSQAVFECDGKMEIDELVERTGVPVHKEGFETVGGLLMKLTGRIPQTGEEVEFGPFRVEILDAGPRRVKRARFVRAALAPGGTDRPESDTPQ